MHLEDDVADAEAAVPGRRAAVHEPRDAVALGEQQAERAAEAEQLRALRRGGVEAVAQRHLCVQAARARA